MRVEGMKYLKTVSIILAGLALAGCSDKGGSEKWGIDHEGPEKKVSHGPMQPNGKYRCDYDKGDATKLAPGQEVKPLTKDTQIRVWHFQNSDEYICLLQGDAVIRLVSN